MITPGAELLADLTGISFPGHMPIAGRRTHEVPAPRRVPGSLDLAFILLRRDASAWRMSRLAYGYARVSHTRDRQVVTLQTDSLSPSGWTVHLTGLAPCASRHVAGAIALAHRGAELGDAIPWSSPRTAGSSRLQALPLRLGGSLYLMTRVAGTTDRQEPNSPQ